MPGEEYSDWRMQVFREACQYQEPLIMHLWGGCSQESFLEAAFPSRPEG